MGHTTDMEHPNPVTPVAPAAAAPGNVPAVITPPSAAATVPVTVVPPEGSVTITAKEYRDLQRAKARTLGFGRRAAHPTPNSEIDPSDPNAAALIQAHAERDEAILKVTQSEVKAKVRDLLLSDKYKMIPQSTKDLILARPHMLTEANTYEEAILDIEDWLDDQAVANAPLPGTPTAPISTLPTARETPPVVSAGAPALVDAGVVEDTTNLRGPARSQAILRNSLRTARIKQ